MSKHHPQSESMKALEQSLNDHMEICSLNRKVKRLKSQNARLKAEVERLRMAGDVMAIWLSGEMCFDDAIKSWNDAKEGKGQP